MPIWVSVGLSLWVFLWVSTVSGMELGAGGSRGVTVVIGREVPDTHCEKLLDNLQVQIGMVDIIPSVVCVGLICHALTCKGAEELKYLDIVK